MFSLIYSSRNAQRNPRLGKVNLACRLERKLNLIKAALSLASVAPEAPEAPVAPEA